MTNYQRLYELEQRGRELRTQDTSTEYQALRHVLRLLPFGQAREAIDECLALDPALMDQITHYLREEEPHSIPPDLFYPALARYLTHEIDALVDGSSSTSP